MPTVKELKQLARKAFDYLIKGDDTEVEVRYGQGELGPISPDAPVIDLRTRNKEREEYIALRDRVFSYLRNHIAGQEEKQRQLKGFFKENQHIMGWNHVVNAVNLERIFNARELTALYGVVRFLRIGMHFEFAHETEEFFNGYFHNAEFRNDFWTYWNRRHAHQLVDVEENENQESSEETRRAVCKLNNETYRCQKCGRFCGKSTYCSNCGF